MLIGYSLTIKVIEFALPTYLVLDFDLFFQKVYRIVGIVRMQIDDGLIKY